MASAIPSWQTDPYAWDRLKINGKFVPGKVRVSYKIANRLDVQKAPKQQHAVLVDQGVPPIEGEIEVEIGFESAPGAPFGTAESQIEAWFALEAELFGRKAGPRKAYTVNHPEFSRKGISKVYLNEPGSLQGSGPGTRTVSMSWCQFAPVYPGETGAVKAGPVKPVGTTDIRTLAAKKPSSGNTGP
jgi:hypothetical protein